MINLFTKQLSAALLGMTILAACSRPVAYFQRGPIESSTTKPIDMAMATQAVNTSGDSLMQTNTTVSQIEAYVRNDNKLAGDKKLNERLIRVRNLLVSTSGLISAKGSPTTRRMNVAETLLLKKMNRRISHQLAPNNPEKTLVKKVPLIGGLVLLIGGLVLLIAGTGTGAFIGLILALIGAVATIVSLLGIDS